MKVTLITAFLLILFAALPLYAQNCLFNVWPPYGGWVCVTSFNVTSFNPQTCTGTLSVTTNTFYNSSTSGSVPIVFSGIGVTCLDGRNLPSGYGCYGPMVGQTTVGFAVSSAQKATVLQLNAAVEYDDNGITIPFSYGPACGQKSCARTGACGCEPEQGTNGGGVAVECGKPIDIASGNTYMTQTDIKRLPGAGPTLMLQRTWNSLWPADQSGNSIGLFGPQWRSTYEERVYPGSDGMMTYSRSDGSFIYFAQNGSVLSAAVPYSPMTVLKSISGGWSLSLRDGETRYFNSAGQLVGIRDRNGNTTSITWDSLGRIQTVTDPASRHLYFGYPTDTSMLVSAVTSDVTYSEGYAYDAQGRLASVTNTDKSVINYEYNDPNHPNFITVVKDSQGKILEAHTYDSKGRGLTSTRADGVEAVSIQYSN